MSGGLCNNTSSSFNPVIPFIQLSHYTKISKKNIVVNIQVDRHGLYCAPNKMGVVAHSGLILNTSS